MRIMKVLVAEKSKEARRKIVEALAGMDSIAVQGAVADLPTAVVALSAARPDLLVVGVELDDGSGLDLIAAAHRVAPRSRIVVVGEAQDRQVWRRHLAAGADRFVEPDAGMTELRDVVTSLASTPASGLRDDELRLLGRMAAGVVHDLNNYIGVIAVMLDELERAPDHREVLADARAAADQTRRLTARLLDYVRGEPGRVEKIDLGALVQRTVAFVARSLPRTIDVQIEIGERMRPVRGVAEELEQLVLNLVLNAADAMPDGGELAVRVLPTGCAALCLEVSDTGVGFSGVASSRADATPSSKPGRRAGLGLGIVHRVVAQHAGAVAIAPRRDHSGTIVTVFLLTA